MNLTSVGNYVMYLLLGGMFVVSSEKIANILFTETPQMSIGDVVHAMHETAHAAQAVGGVAKTGAKAAGGIAKTAVNTAGNIVGGGFAALKSGADTFKSVKGNLANHSVSDGKGGTKPMSNAGKNLRALGGAALAGLGTAGALAGRAVGQGIGDAAKKALTGKAPDHLDKEGRNTTGAIKAGQSIKKDGIEKTATMKDAQASRNAVGSKISGALGKIGQKNDKLAGSSGSAGHSTKA